MKTITSLLTRAARKVAPAMALLFTLSAAADPVAKIGETEYDTLEEAFSAVGSGETIQIILAGEYAVQNLQLSNCTLEATVNGVVFKHTAGYGSWVASCENFTVKNITFDTGVANYQYFKCGTVIGCTFKGIICSHSYNTFTDCIFYAPGSEGSGISTIDYSMWCYGRDTTFTRCSFYGAGKFLNVYCESNTNPYNIVAEDCHFYSTKANKAAFNVKENCFYPSGDISTLIYNVRIKNCDYNNASYFPTISIDKTGTLVVLHPLVQVDDRTAGRETKLTIFMDDKQIYPEVAEENVAEVNGTSYATPTEAVTAAVTAATAEKPAEITLTETTEASATITDFVSAIAAEAGANISLTVPTANGTVSFNRAAIDGIKAKAGSTAVEVSIAETTKPEGVTVSDKAKVYDITLTGATVTETAGGFGTDGEATVTLPVPTGILNPVVYYINGATKALVKSTIADGNISFKTSHFSTYSVEDLSVVEVATLEDLKTAVQSDCVIKLTADITLTEQVSIVGKQIVLDLNEHTITCEEQAPLYAQSSDLTVKNGSMTGTGWVIYSYESQVVIESDAVVQSSTSAILAMGASQVTVKGNVVGEQYYGIIAGNANTKVAVNGGTVSGKTGILVETGAIAKVESGTVNGTAWPAITLAGGGAEVSGGTVTATSDVGVWINNANSKLTVDGGTVTGLTGILVGEGAIATIESGTVTGTAWPAITLAGGNAEVNGGTVTAPNDVGVWIRTTNSTLAVSDGTITSGSNKAILSVGNIVVDGGTISSSSSNAIESSGSVVVNGGNISSTCASAVYSEGTIAVHGGELSGYTYGVYAKGETVTIDGGLVSGATQAGVILEGSATSATISGNAEITGKQGIYLNSAGGSITINGGKVNATRYGIYAVNGSVSVNGGAIESAELWGVLNRGATSTTTITGGTITGAVVGVGTYGSATISGGTISGGSAYGVYTYGASSAATITGGTIKSTNNTSVSNNGGSMAVSGGTFSDDSVAQYCTGGYKAVMNEDGTFTATNEFSESGYVVTLEATSNVGDHPASAVTTATSGNTVTITVKVDGKEEKTFDTYQIDVTYNKNIFVCETDSDEDGIVTVSDMCASTSSATVGTIQFVVKDGITADECMAYPFSFGANAKVYDSTNDTSSSLRADTAPTTVSIFTSVNVKFQWDYKEVSGSYAYNVYYSQASSDIPTLTSMGIPTKYAVKFVGWKFDDSSNVFDNDYVAAVTHVRDVVYTAVFEDDDATAVAEVNGTKYVTLQDAIADAADGGTVTLLQDSNVVTDYDKHIGEAGYSEAAGENRIIIHTDAKFTLDLGGHTLSGRINFTKGNMTVKNGTLAASSQAVNIYGSKNYADRNTDYSVVTLASDVTINSTYGLAIFGGDPSNTYYPLGFGETFNVYCKITANSPVYVSGNIGMDNYTANTGTLEDVEACKQETGLSVSELSRLYGPRINIYDGAVLTATASNPSENSQGVTIQGGAVVNVYGGSITGNDGIGLKGGSLNVYGGTIRAVGARVDPVEAVNSGSEASGAAISVSTAYNSNQPVHVSIEGGNISSLNNAAVLVVPSFKNGVAIPLTTGAYVSITGGQISTDDAGQQAVYIDDSVVLNSEVFSVTVSGGTFSTAVPETYCAEGYEPKLLENGQYGVVEVVVEWNGTGTAVDPYVITNEAELKLLATRVNGENAADYNDKFYRLGNDITLKSENWTPIGNGKRSGTTYTGNVFKGVFDGCDHVISSLKMSGATTDKDVCCGLFGIVSGATIKNLTLAGVAVNLTVSEHAGALVGTMVNNSTVSRVAVSGSVASAQCGGLIGRMAAYGTISACTNNATVSATGPGAGGIVAKAYYTKLDQTMEIVNCVNNGAVSGSSYTGGIAGLCSGNVTECRNTATIKSKGISTGGIVGEQTSYGTVSRCVNEANITGGGKYGTGGIIGWIRYQVNTSYPLSEVVSVTSCTNSGTIVNSKDINPESSGAGGIVGLIYNAAKVTGNVSTAASISAHEFASGVVGGIQQAKDNGYYQLEAGVLIDGNTSTTTMENIIGDISYNRFAWNNDNSRVYFPEVAVAVIGNTQYSSLTSAIAAAADGETVKLLASTTESVTIPAEKSITLDLNGKTLTGTGAHTINNAGTLTVTDSSETSTGAVVAATGSYAAVMNTGTANLNGGTFSTEAWYGIVNSGTMTIDGAKVTTDNNAASLIRNLGTSAENVATLTIESGTFVNGLNTVKNDDFSSLTINGGTFTNPTRYTVQNWTTCVINGGEFNGSGTAVVMNACYTDGDVTTEGKLTINGGTFNGKTIVAGYTNNKETPDPNATAGTASITGGAFTASNSLFDSAQQDSIGIAVSGGTFSAAVPEEYCASGYIPTSTTVDGVTTYGVKTGAYVARNMTTGQGYESFMDAIDSLQEGDTVKLLANINLSQQLTINGKSYTLDLNGKAIISTAIYAILVSDGILTIEDSSEEGTGRVKTTASNSTAVRASGSAAGWIIKGGTFKGTQNSVVAVSSSAKGVIEGGVFESAVNIGSSTSDKSITGGKFKVKPESTFVDGYVISSTTDADDYYWVVRPVVVVKTITDGEGTVITTDASYGSLAKAFAAIAMDADVASAEYVITLNANQSTSATLNATGAKVTLDLNGKNISVNSGNAILVKAGLLTIVDSSEGKPGLVSTSDTATNTAAVRAEGSQSGLVVNGGKFSGGAYAVLVVNSATPAAITGGVFESAVSIGNSSVDKSITGGKFKVKPESTFVDGYVISSTTDADEYYWVVRPVVVVKTITDGEGAVTTTDASYGSLAKAFVAIATDADVASAEYVITLNANQSTSATLDAAGAKVKLDLNGKSVSVSGSNAIIVNNGALTIVDGSEDKTGAVASTTDYAVRVNGSGASIVIEGGCYTGADDNKGSLQAVNSANGLVITGGKFVNALTIGTTAKNVSISGGLFKVQTEEKYLAENYMFAASEEEPSYYEVTTAGASVTANGRRKLYLTLAEAVTAAPSGATVELLKNIANGDGIIINKPVTIDLGGHTYTVTQNFAGSSNTKNQCFQILQSAGDVTIKNGTIAPGAIGIKMIIQNYANLTLTDVTLKGTEVGYALSNNCGAVLLNGSTTVEGTMDVSYWPSAYPAGSQVTIDTTGSIGTIELGFYGANGEITLPTKSVLTLTNGTVGEVTIYAPTSGPYSVGDVTKEELMEAAQVTKSDSVTIETIPTDYKWENGTLVPRTYVAQVVSSDGVTTNKYESFTTAVSSATLGATIKLLADVDLSGATLTYSRITISGKMLDLGGHVLTMGTNYVYVGVNSNDKIVTSTITDSVGGGKITGTGDKVVLNFGNLVIKGGSIEGNKTYGVKGQSNSGYATPVLKVEGGYISASTYAIYVIGSKVIIGEEGASNDNVIIVSTGSAETKPRGVAAFSNSEVTVNSGTITSGYSGIYLKGSQCTINKGNITGSKDGVYGLQSSIEVKDGLINGAYGVAVLGNGNANTAYLTVSGGKITSSIYGISGNGDTGDGGTVFEVSGGEVSGDWAGIYLPAGNSVTTVSGGTISGGSGIEIRSGTLNVSGGDISATSNEFSCEADGDGNTTAGAAIAIAQHTTKNDIIVNITGGTFSGVRAVNESNPQENDPDPQVTLNISNGTFTGSDKAIAVVDYDNVAVSGGTFSTAVPEEYCADDYEPATKQDDNGMWTVKEMEDGSMTVELVEGKAMLVAMPYGRGKVDWQTILDKSSLEDGTTVKVPDGNKGYACFALSNGKWTRTDEGTVEPSISTGDAIWVTSPSKKTVTLKGKVPTNPVSVTIAPGVNIVSFPGVDDNVDLNTLGWTDASKPTADDIVELVDDATQKTCYFYYVRGKWVSVSLNAPKIDKVVKKGRGFIYHRMGTTESSSLPKVVKQAEQGE